MVSIDWGRLDQRAFDRVVEALYSAENEDLPLDAYAVNGRGGDKGIDIHIRRDGRLTIVQLKFSPEGFSGGFADTRRRQIKQSFRAAMKHSPDEWWLVFPSTATHSERQFVTRLTKSKPEIVIVDRPALDVLAAKHPDLVKYFERNTLMEAVKVFNKEQALLIDHSDLTARIAALGKQVDTLHPDWDLNFSRTGNTVVIEPVPRHPRAAEQAPITLNMDFSVLVRRSGVAAVQGAHARVRCAGANRLTALRRYQVCRRRARVHRTVRRTCRVVDRALRARARCRTCVLGYVRWR